MFQSLQIRRQPTPRALVSLISMFLSQVLWNHALNAKALEGQIFITDKKGNATQGDCRKAVAFLNSDTYQDESPPPQDLQILMQNSSFVPDILVVKKGSKVTFPNEDSIQHNAFSLSKKKSFDLGLYGKGEKDSVVFDKTGLVKVFCNIHPEMVAHVLILENSHFARAKEDCSFSIKTPPDGKYELSVWYAFGKGSKTDIVVKGGLVTEPSAMKLKVKQSRRKFKPHRNKDGKRYKKTY